MRGLHMRGVRQLLGRAVRAGAVLLLAGPAAGPAALAGGAPQAGRPAPTLVATQLDGRVFDLAMLRGRVVIVNFWASWCAPCRAEMPLLDSFYQRHHAQGLELLGVSVDDTHDKAAVLRIMQQFSYPAALASSAKINGFGPSLAVPTTWIVDADGVVRARLLAANGVTEQSLNDTVLPLLPAPAAGQ
jgi:cytochrome c biogenesis protein CcmG, thiol:disulfide interchange protein DsbE